MMQDHKLMQLGKVWLVKGMRIQVIIENVV